MPNVKRAVHGLARIASGEAPPRSGVKSKCNEKDVCDWLIDQPPEVLQRVLVADSKAPRSHYYHSVTLGELSTSRLSYLATILSSTPSKGV